MLTGEPIVQIHPSRFCNYSCLHCYSSSSSDARGGLAVDALLSTTALLADEGYLLASLSGGEPMLYPKVDALALGLRQQGFTTAIISNGTRAADLVRLMDDGLVAQAAISLDGPRTLHDRIRARVGAFDRALEAIDQVVDAGHPIGVVVAVTTHSLPHLPDMIAELAQRGVNLIQLHPIAIVGRATSNIAALGSELSEEALLRLLLMTEAFAIMYPSVQLHCDAVLGQDLAQLPIEQEQSLISPVVIRDCGFVVPYTYDTSKDYSLGRVGEGKLQCRNDQGLIDLLLNARAISQQRAATTIYGDISAMSRLQRI